MKKRLWKRLLTAYVSAAMVFSTMTATAFAGEVIGEPVGAAAGTLQTSTLLDGNLHEQDYSRWSYCINSYLVQDGSGYIRVESPRYRDEGENDTILVGYYDHDLKLQSERDIPQELSMFGGFYAGTDSYYIVFGQENMEEDDNKEVVRVVKYDKDWNRLGAASLCGANTTIPFDAGSLRMTEYGGYLYIRTSHEMYTTSDGLNHQANLTIQVRTADMTISDYFADIWNIAGGYVSHSFNQFILADDAGNLVAMDHGDAHPRSIVLGRYGKKAGDSSFYSNYSYVDLIEFQGETGDNDTGASAGGLEYSDTHYLSAGNSVIQDSGWASRDVRNIFVTAVSRSNLSGGGLWITNYDEGAGISASTPQLVKLSGNSFLLLWEQYDYNEYEYPEKICYIFLDGSGNPVSDIYTENGNLSDCQPIFDGESVIWYAYGSKMTFYKIDMNGNLSCIREALSLSDCNVKLKDGSKTYVYDGKKKKPALKITSKAPGKHTLKKGEDYTVKYKNNVNVGIAEAEITGIGDYDGTVTLTFQIVPKGTNLTALKAQSKGLKVQWKKQAKQTSGYEIQYARDKKFTNSPGAITVTDGKTTSAKISGLSAKKTYYVRIRTFKTVTIDGVSQNICSAWSSAKKMKTK